MPLGSSVEDHRRQPTALKTHTREEVQEIVHADKGLGTVPGR